MRIEKVDLESILLYRIWKDEKQFLFILMEEGELTFFKPTSVIIRRGVEK
jgi:hypothetical protein